MRPCNWVDEDRPEIAEAIVDSVISQMTYEEMRQFVWDRLYEEMLDKSWSDLWMMVEDYAPDYLEEFDDPLKNDTLA